MSNDKVNSVPIIESCDVRMKKGMSNSDLSDVARIDFKSDDPLELFKEWYEEAKTYSNGMPNALCLATVSKQCQVSARHVLLRDYDHRGFVIVTDSRSRKAHELDEVPKAAMCILWAYPNERQQNISRQVRIEGKMEKLSPEDFRYLYDREPLYCKIRSHLCWQGTDVDWDQHKVKHDKLIHDVRTGKQNLSMPAHFVGYRLHPECMEYYFAYDHLIGDRIIFKKTSDSWTRQRIAA